MHGTSRGKNEGRDRGVGFPVGGEGVRVDPVAVSGSVVVASRLFGVLVQDNLICWRGSGAHDPALVKWA
eukprot:7986746-Pyramimonas_sp.AAC.1